MKWTTTSTIWGRASSHEAMRHGHASTAAGDDNAWVDPYEVVPGCGSGVVADAVPGRRFLVRKTAPKGVPRRRLGLLEKS